jgi:hypothetical protein
MHRGQPLVTQQSKGTNHPLSSTDASGSKGTDAADLLEAHPAALTLLNAGNVVWWLQKLTLSDATLRAAVRIERSSRASAD